MDAGRAITFVPVELSSSDTPDSVKAKIHSAQYESLEITLSLIQSGFLGAGETLVRPKKNHPMTDSEKADTLTGFEAWKQKNLLRQAAFRELCAACERDELAVVQAALERYPELLEQKNKIGWNPLIVACRNKAHRTATFLLEKSADPNAKNIKGTTALMYAKTPLLDDREFPFLEELIGFGAKVNSKDNSSRTVLDYIGEDKSELIRFLVSRGALRSCEM